MPNYTRAASNEKIFRWTFAHNLNLKYASTKLSSDLSITPKAVDKTSENTVDPCETPNTPCCHICDCGTGTSCKSCKSSELWIRLAFNTYSRPFSYSQEARIFNDLITLADSLDNDPSLKNLNCVYNDISRTVPSEEYFNRQKEGYNRVASVLRGFSIYDNK